MANELPSVGAGFIPGYGGTQHDSNGSMFFPIMVNYEADIFLKNHDKTKSSKKTYEASIQDERAAYISVVSAVGTTYFNIVQLDRLIESQKQINKLRKDIYNAMLISNREGVTSTSDVVKANKALVMGEASLLDLEKTRIQALNQFAVLIGESPANISSLKRASYDSIVYKFNAPNEISSEIITQRPDYLKSEIMLQKAGIDVKVAKKEFLPSINIGGLALFNVLNSSGNMFPNFIWGFGGSIFETFFTGGAKMANLRMNKVKYERMLKTYQNTNLVSIQEVNDALYAYKYDNDKYKQNVKNKNLEARDFNLSKKMYEQGVISKLDLNQRQENLLIIDNMVVQSKIGCIVESIKETRAMERAAGVKKPSVSNKDALSLYSKINGRNKKLVNYMLKKRNADGTRTFKFNEIISTIEQSESKLHKQKFASPKTYKAADGKAYYANLLDAQIQEHGKLQRTKKS